LGLPREGRQNQRLPSAGLARGVARGRSRFWAGRLSMEGQWLAAQPSSDSQRRTFWAQKFAWLPSFSKFGNYLGIFALV